MTKVSYVFIILPGCVLFKYLVGKKKRSKRDTSHLSEHFILLVSNANQFLNKTIGEVPAQHVRNQQRRLERAPAVREHTVLSVNWIKRHRVCVGASDSGCYGDLKKSEGTERNANREREMAAAVEARGGHSYRGWVRVPWRTRATWEMHWERMLLRSWLTFGWLHIWGQNTNRQFNSSNKVRGVLLTWAEKGRFSPEHKQDQNNLQTRI